MALSRAHTSAKAADLAKTRPVKHAQCRGVSFGMHLVVTINLP